MNRDTRVHKMGALGEQLVADYFSDIGCTVKQSEDWYDSEKDMTVDGETVEIKTLLPIYMYNAFCLPQSQSKKCEEVDRLIFVKIPEKSGEPLEVYESMKDEDGRRYDFRETFNNEKCQFYRIPTLTKLGTIDDVEVSKEIWDLSPSRYKSKFKYLKEKYNGT